MPAPKIRCGVAGVGSLGQHHARIYASLPGAELAGIYDTSEARAAEISAKLGCRRFASLDELGARATPSRSSCRPTGTPRSRFRSWRAAATS
jgi:predicted dehydrogenase